MNKYDDTDYLIEREESIEYEEGSDTNVASIEKDIKRCEELIRPEHANWIGISNQLAIAHVVDRVKEVENDLTTVYLKGYADAEEKYRKKIKEGELTKEFLPKQKVKDLIKNETINISGFKCIAVEDLEELLEESK